MPCQFEAILLSLFISHSEVSALPDSETVDVDPEGPQVRTGGDAGRVPDCRPPGRVAVVVRDENVTKYFPWESQVSTIIGPDFATMKTPLKTRNGLWMH